MVVPLTVIGVYGGTRPSSAASCELSQRRRVSNDGSSSPWLATVAESTRSTIRKTRSRALLLPSAMSPSYSPGVVLAGMSTPNQSGCTLPRSTRSARVKRPPDQSIPSRLKAVTADAGIVSVPPFRVNEVASYRRESIAIRWAHSPIWNV
jgi:hypothetical protein